MSPDASTAPSRGGLDLTFTAGHYRHDTPETWTVSTIATTNATSARVVFTRQTNSSSGARIRATFTPAGLTLDPGRQRWTGTSLSTAAQPLLHDTSTVRHLLAAELQAADEAELNERRTHANIPAPSSYTHYRHLLTLLIATYELADAASRATALAALAAGYTGTVEDLLAAVRTAATP